MATGTTGLLDARPQLMPWPQRIALEGGAVRVARTETRWSGVRSRRLAAEVERLAARLPGLVIECAEAATPYPQLGDDEGYRLQIDRQGDVRLAAPCEWGILRGLATLVQLGERTDDAIELPVGVIEDAPRFPWRGLMIDVARHFMPIEALQRTLEAMAFVKLNVLHLHLTDDQGFRFPSAAYPKLAEVGGRGQFYGAEELRKLIERAAELGIRVVPEIDVPGHVTSWLAAYPEFARLDTALPPSDRFGVHEAALDPSNEYLYPALETLLGEVCEIFPDAFLHIGGDEVEGSWWRDSVPIRRFMREQNIADVGALQAHFNQRASKQLRWLGRRMIGWDEVIDARLPERVIVQSWRGARSRDRALAAGFDCVFSAGYYLDLFYPADVHYAFDPEASAEALDSVERDMLEDDRLAHVRDGLAWSRDHAAQAGPVARLAGREPGTVLGGEACLWSELVTEEILDQRLWGRLPAIAERLWSGAGVTDVMDMYRRLEATVARLPEVSAVDLDADRRAALARLGIDAALEPLLEVLEPVKWYARLLGPDASLARTEGRELSDPRPYTVRTPLDRLVDVLPPESLRARDVVRRLGGADPGELRALARAWRSVPEVSGELGPLADALRRLGALLEAVAAGSVPSDAAASLEAAREPHAELFIVVAADVARLVTALEEPCDARA